MGNFITRVKDEIEKLPQINSTTLKNLSLSKIREYHSNYKMVCETFSINFSEFEQIFGSVQSEFVLWDTDFNGLIDSLELFTGIILFAECSSDEKIKFIFDLFDFNDIHSIGFYDFCFLLESAINSVFKVHKIAIAFAGEEIEEFANRYVFPTQRIKLADFKRLISQSKESLDFHTIFRLDPLILKEESLKNSEGFKIYGDQYQFYKNNLLFTETSDKLQLNWNPSYLFENKRFESYRNWVSSAMKMLTNYRSIDKQAFIYANPPIEYNIKLDWVYGVRVADVKRPVQYLNSGIFSRSTGFMDFVNRQKSAESIFLYVIGKLVVVYYLGHNKQKYYFNHENEVISVTFSPRSSMLCASGELGKKPAIHIWNSESMHTLQVLKGYHSIGVHILEFTFDEKYLLSCNLRSKSSIVIFEWEIGTIILSLQTESTVQDACMIYLGDFNEYSNDENKKSNTTNNSSFVISTVNEILLIQFNANSTISNSSFKTSKDSSIIAIYCVKSDVLGSEKPDYMLYNSVNTVSFFIVTGHMDGSVIIWSKTGFVKLVKKYESEVVCITEHRLGIVIGTALSELYIVNF